LSSALTDEQGMTTLQIMAGAGSDDQKTLTFGVQASCGAVAVVVPVFITSGALSSVEIVPVIESPLDGENRVASILLFFYDDTTCSQVYGENPTPTIRPVRTLSTDNQPVLFTNVVGSGVHAVLAMAMDTRNRVVAKGCADLLGTSLSPTQVMRIRLPLSDMYTSPVGTYRVDTRFTLTGQLPGIASAREQWNVLSTRACDPASVWLDCTLDALSGDSPDDPLDCRPVSGGEGDLGAVLSAHRSADTSLRPCSSQIDPSGNPSLDARTYNLFPSSFLVPLGLSKLPEEVAIILSQMVVTSTLTVVESGLVNVLNFEHTLESITLPNPNAQAQPTLVSALGLPIGDVWFSSRQTRPGFLELGSHGFTLRLGSLARFTLGTASLVPRLGVADVGAFVAALFNGTTRKTTRSSLLQGCDALDSLLCEEAGLDRGCIKAACQSGVAALAQRLDDSFAALDGPGRDFFLSGSAPLLDTNGDGRADAVASSLMTASFSSPGGASAVYGMWSAQRILPSAP